MMDKIQETIFHNPHVHQNTSCSETRVPPDGGCEILHFKLGSQVQLQFSIMRYLTEELELSKSSEITQHQLMFHMVICNSL
jgi:hypothetical protein